MNAVYAENGIYAELDTFRYKGKKYCSIYSFSSYYPGRGNAKKALIEIKRRYGRIHAMDIGSDPSQESWKFWKYMKKIRVVYKIYDDENNEVT